MDAPHIDQRSLGIRIREDGLRRSFSALCGGATFRTARHDNEEEILFELRISAGMLDADIETIVEASARHVAGSIPAILLAYLFRKG